jgi:DNA invertase Pin-like site-specific DNA recombinase
MIYGYIRVSTDAQDCENQKIGINELAQKLNLRIEKWIEDQGVSGMKDPKKRNLGKLMKILKPNDHILISEISRLSRELFTIFELLKFFTEKSIKLNTVKDNYVLDGSITSKVLAFAFGMAANIERDMISKRTIEGLEARRRAGVIIGRPIGAASSRKKLDDKEYQIKKYIKLGLSYSAIAKLTHTHRLTVSRICRERGWDSEYPPERKWKNSGINVKNIKRGKDLSVSLENILEMYAETKSLTRCAELLNTSSAILKGYLQRKNYWKYLLKLDDKLRLQFPSINRSAKIYKQNNMI